MSKDNLPITESFMEMSFQNTAEQSEPRSAPLGSPVADGLLYVPSITSYHTPEIDVIGGHTEYAKLEQRPSRNIERSAD